MNRKALSLLIAVVTLLSIVPVSASLASAAGVSSVMSPTKITIPPKTENDLMPFMTHRMGALKAPLHEYEQIVGFHFNPMTESAFKEALKNAPFNPTSASILLPNGTSNVPSTLPSGVFNSLYLPPVGNQGYVGSCNAWSSTYYVWTYMINWWRNNPHPHTLSDIMNPTFTYNLINGGGDWGSLPWDAMNLISTIGAVPLKDFPLYVLGPYGDPSDYAWVWPNFTQWEEAAHNRGTSAMYWWQYYEPGTPQLYQIPGQWYYLDFTNATQWNYTKALLAKGYVLQTTINVLPSFQFLGQPTQFLGYLQFYAQYANEYGQKYWTNGSYALWSIGNLIDQAHVYYNVWASTTPGNTTELLKEGNMSVALMKDVLQNKLGIDLNEPVYLAAEQLEAAVNARFINNQSWINNAKFYLSAYSINGEKWFLNNGFDVLFTLANLEWMIHYIPIGKYLQSRAPYLNFNNYYLGWQGGHAVTIVGYNDTITTPDGKGALIMVNSWGTNWGYNGYWLFSYDAIRSAGEYFNTTVDGIFPVEYQIEWPSYWGGSAGFVYVPKAANYIPKLMAIVGIKHPVRGEVVDGVIGENQFIPAGIPVSLKINGTPIWEHNFLDFWIDYYWGDITNKTTAADLPQDHPFPDSPMDFDISDAIPYIVQYLVQNGSAPRYITLTVTLHDLLRDNITGTVYKLGFDYPNVWEGVSYDPNVTIPDGGNISVNFTMPIVDYDIFHTTPNNETIPFGNFEVAVHSIIPLNGAYLVIDNKTYELSAENGGYYYYATGIDQKLKLPAGTYNYTVIVTYPNGKEVALPPRTVTIKEPLVYVLSPKPEVYNESQVKVEVKVVDVLNISSVTAIVGTSKYKLSYNSTLGLYMGVLNLTNGFYTLKIIARDTANNTGTAEVNFFVHTNTKVVSIPINNETKVTVGVIGSANVTAKNNTIIANVTTSKGETLTVEVPLVNNVPSIIINTTALENVVNGNSNTGLVAGWNATISKVKNSTTKTNIQKGNKVLYSMTIKANVTLGENGVAVVAFGNINVSKIYIWKNGQKIQLTTNESNPFGYYYIQDGVVFVVLKEDPIVEVDGFIWKTIPVNQSSGISLAVLNFLGYRWYNMYSKQFEELYNEALKLGVNESLLQEAVKLNQTASDYYKKALDLSGGNILLHLGDVKLLPVLRKAYLNEMKAVELLQKAIEQLKEQGS